MYSAYKLNKQGDNIQPWRTPFPIWSQFIVPCLVLTVVFWPQTDFSGGRSGGLVFPSLEEFSLLWSTVKDFARSRCFSGILLVFFFFFLWSTRCWNLISGSSAFSKSNLNIWKFSVHILKSSLENFDHYFASVWDECNCAVAWTFFGIACLWDWNENWPFPVLWPCEFSKFTGILSAALLRHHLLGLEIAQLEFHHLY